MGKAKKPSAAEALRDILAGGVATAGVVEALPPATAGKRPARTTTAAKPAAAKTAPSKPKVETPKLSDALARKLKAATAKQIEMIRSRLKIDADAVVAAPDADGDVLVRYVPGWEQGRMVGGKLVKGLSRQFPYLIHKDGSLSGHGYRYRSSGAEAKLKPLEEKNAARLQREAKKVAA